MSSLLQARDGPTKFPLGVPVPSLDNATANDKADRITKTFVSIMAICEGLVDDIDSFHTSGC